MLWQRPHQPPRNRSRKLLLGPEPSLGLGVKAYLAALGTEVTDHGATPQSSALALPIG